MDARRTRFVEARLSASCGQALQSQRMKSHHAAALALVGWYLMVPPLGDGLKHNDNAPLRLWKIEESFDTAAECREMKITGWKQAKNQHSASLSDEYMKAACVE